VEPFDLDGLKINVSYRVPDDGSASRAERAGAGLDLPRERVQAPYVFSCHWIHTLI
jgi:hypothetical protein